MIAKVIEVLRVAELRKKILFTLNASLAAPVMQNIWKISLCKYFPKGDVPCLLILFALQLFRFILIPQFSLFCQGSWDGTGGLVRFKFR